MPPLVYLNHYSAFVRENSRYNHYALDNNSKVTHYNLPDSINNGVVDSISLGKDGSPDGSQRSDSGIGEDASEVNDEVRSPCHEPQRDGHQGNLHCIGNGSYRHNFISMTTIVSND